MITKLKGDT